MMKLAMAQMAMAPDIETNYRKTLDSIQAAKGCDLLFFPEIQWTPFFPQYRAGELAQALGKDRDSLALPIDDGRIQTLAEMCREHRLWLSPNLYIRDKGKDYDMSLMFDSGGALRGTSKMVHVFQAERFYERDYYTPSEEGFSVYEAPFGKIGVVICFDRHLPESIRTCAKMGAELIIIPTANVKSEPLELFEWEIRTQAFQNNVFIAMCNRTGREDRMDFAGESLVAGPNGELIYKADDKERLIVCELDLSLARESRANRPYIELVRPECYR